MVRARKIELCGKLGTVELSADGTKNWICLCAADECGTEYNKAYFLPTEVEIHVLGVLIYEILEDYDSNFTPMELEKIKNMIRMVIW